MNSTKQIVKTLEAALNVKLKRSRKRTKMSENSYKISTSYSADRSIRYDKVTHLCLSNRHFDDFSELEAVFETLNTLILVKCSISDGWQLHDLKRLDYLTLKKCSFSIDPKRNQKSNFRLSSLDLIRTSSGEIEQLASVFYSVYTLSISKSTLENTDALLRFDFVSGLNLTKVAFANEEHFDPEIDKANTIHRQFQSIRMKNMTVKHPGNLLPLSNHLEYVEFANCTVSNLYECNLYPQLYSLTFDETNYIGEGSGEHYEQVSDERLTFLNFEDMELTDLDFFLPFSKGLPILDLYNCKIDSLASILQLTDLSKLRLHPTLEVNDRALPKHIDPSFVLEECIIGPRTTTYHMDEVALAPDFNVEMLLSIAPYIERLIIQGYHLIQTDFLKHFTNLRELSFERCSVDLNDYISIAAQIKAIRFDTTNIDNQQAFASFTQLERLEVYSYDDDIGHIDLKTLLPLKEQLAHIDIFFWMMRNTQYLGDFSALQELDTSISSIELAQDILSISALKKLDLSISDVTPPLSEPVVLDLQHLTHLEQLRLSADDGISFKGIRHLTALKTLDLSFDCEVEHLDQLPSLEKLELDSDVLPNLPRLDQLKVLDLTCNAGEGAWTMEQFPNLEKLQISIHDNQQIDLAGLEKLNVLVFENNNLDGIVSFENLPSLESLSLSNCSISDLSKLKSLQNLTTLNLEESELKSIEGLQYLKRLERVNLYYNDLSDIRLLNELPYLKEANIAGNDIQKEEAEHQMDNPEIIRWYGRPYIPFRISIDH